MDCIKYAMAFLTLITYVSTLPLGEEPQEVKLQRRQCSANRDSYGRVQQHCDNTPKCTYGEDGEVLSCVL